MKKHFYPYLFSFIILLNACSEKDKPIEIQTPQIPFWKMVQGTYKVINLENNNEFQSRIVIKTDTQWVSVDEGLIKDSIIIYNFNNSFDSIIYKYQTGYSTSNLNYLGIYPFHGVNDKQSNRWLVYSLEDTSNISEENTWINGEITFYFRMNNTAYWNEDGVPYQDLYIKQKATRIGD